MTCNSLPSGSYFLCDIPDIQILTAQTCLQVVITIGGKTIYEETLYPADGTVTVADLADIFRPYARQQLRVEASVSITEQSVSTDGETTTAVDTKTVKLKVYYADVCIVGTDCEKFFSSHFLTLLQDTKETAIGRLEYLHYMGTDSATVTATYDDGSTQQFAATAVGGNAIYTTIDVSPSRFEASGETLSYYEVRAGSRLMTFLIDQTCPDCAPILLFTNSFGCQELLYCLGKHEVDPDYTRDAAYIGGLNLNYRITQKRTFNADTGYLSTSMAQWAEDLFTSAEVYLVNIIDSKPVVGKRVTITDSKSKRDNLPDNMPRYTFSYVYAQRQHKILDLQRGGRIFDNTFDNTFN